MRVEVLGKPKPVNATRRANMYAQAAETKEWREQFAWHAKVQRMKPIPTPVVVHVRQKIAKGKLPDAGSNSTVGKAGLDGLVDAGLLPDDSPQYVRAVVLHAPVKADRDSLIIELETVSA